MFPFPFPFQSPSLRGSGRFFQQVVAAAPPSSPRFNPLHCGAVVASRRFLLRHQLLRQVSIPFIAGQWSLRARRMAGGGTEGSFNPLHCGAVVASGPRRRRSAPPSGFQSPSLRGSGRFARSWPRHPTRRSRFNPLHCGAVVASRGAARPGHRRGPFQSPSLRGSGRFGTMNNNVVGLHVRFQSPSLRGSGRFMERADLRVYRYREFQSPSLRGSGRFPRRSGRDHASAARFNPLHCGAVVASVFRLPGGPGSPPVSIPFIAGQWSLQGGFDIRLSPELLFQSPSLRGSGRFAPCAWRCGWPTPCFNPLHCGAVVASRLWHVAGFVTHVFQSPSLRGSGRFRTVRPGARGAARFQSPSLRGSGRFRAFAHLLVAFVMFQSPSLRGSGRFIGVRVRLLGAVQVSIPFIAGQWSLQGNTSLR
jgi:hypothetical protein